MPRDGLPNYFDDQRFGSVGYDGDFIARAWLAATTRRPSAWPSPSPTASDRPDAKEEKAILRETWGDWAEAKARLPRSHARSLVTYLVDHPTDFRGAFARVRRELRSLYFSAFQSHLWNLDPRPADRADHPARSEDDLVEFKAAHLADPPRSRPRPGRHPRTPRELPLPASQDPPARMQVPMGEVAREVAASFGLAWEDLRVKHLKDVFFSKGDRPALFFAGRISPMRPSADDDLYPGRKKLALGFELPKGAYATLVVKRVTDAANPAS